MPVKEEEAQPDSPAQKVDIISWRAQGFSELGFGDDDAFVLANTKRANKFYLYWGDVEKALKAGATHAQIIDWFT